MGVHYLEATAKLAHQSICIAAEGFEEATRSGKDVLNPSEAGLHHGRRGDTVARAHASEIEGLFHVVLIARPAGDAGGLLGGVAERPAALIRAEPRKDRRRAGGTEQRGEAVRGAMHFVIEAGGGDRPSATRGGGGGENEGAPQGRAPPGPPPP